MSCPKPLIAVVGALGAQGGSVVRFLLASDRFRVRALTRNPDSEKAIGEGAFVKACSLAHQKHLPSALKEKGVEVVSANIDDPASLERAFGGAYGVFGLTNCKPLHLSVGILQTNICFCDRQTGSTCQRNVRFSKGRIWLTLR